MYVVGLIFVFLFVLRALVVVVVLLFCRSPRALLYDVFELVLTLLVLLFRRTWRASRRRT